MLVLASASPRRKAILENAGFEFTVCPAKGEISPGQNARPDEFVVENALLKAREVADIYDENQIILGADTIVYHDGEILGKPKDKAQAFEMLKRLSNRTHQVYTGYAVIHGDKTVTGCEITSVTFRALDDREIEDYIATGEPFDKAGAYGIQGRGCVFVSRIEGDFFNVAGLPICRINLAIKSTGGNN